MATTEEVAAATDRLAAAGLATATRRGTAACYAVQDKVWVEDPSGSPWEIYTVLADAPEAAPRAGSPEGAACCAGTPVAGTGPGACC